MLIDKMKELLMDVLYELNEATWREFDLFYFRFDNEANLVADFTFWGTFEQSYYHAPEHKVFIAGNVVFKYNTLTMPVVTFKEVYDPDRWGITSPLSDASSRNISELNRIATIFAEEELALS